jgi:hypothetical protein
MGEPAVIFYAPDLPGFFNHFRGGWHNGYQAQRSRWRDQPQSQEYGIYKLFL